MIYAFYGRLSVGTTDVDLLRSGSLPPPSTATAPGPLLPGNSWPTPTRRRRRDTSVGSCSWTAHAPWVCGAQGTESPTYDQWLTVFSQTS